MVCPGHDAEFFPVAGAEVAGRVDAEADGEDGHEVVVPEDVEVLDAGGVAALAAEGVADGDFGHGESLVLGTLRDLKWEMLI